MRKLTAFRIDIKTLRDLKRISKKKDLSMSHIVRQAIKQYIKEVPNDSKT
jgi:predicted DNA-binding protein